MSCDVDFGSSGAPIFTFDGQTARIVSVVSAKAEVEGTKVALGTQLDRPLQVLRAELTAGRSLGSAGVASVGRITVGGGRSSTGAKFVKP